MVARAASVARPVTPTAFIASSAARAPSRSPSQRLARAANCHWRARSAPKDCAAADMAIVRASSSAPDTNAIQARDCVTAARTCGSMLDRSTSRASVIAIGSGLPRSAWITPEIDVRSSRKAAEIPRCSRSATVSSAQSQSPVSRAAAHATSASCTAMSRTPMAVASSNPWRAVSIVARGIVGDDQPGEVVPGAQLGVQGSGLLGLADRRAKVGEPGLLVAQPEASRAAGHEQVGCDGVEPKALGSGQGTLGPLQAGAVVAHHHAGARELRGELDAGGIGADVADRHDRGLQLGERRLVSLSDQEHAGQVRACARDLLGAPGFGVEGHEVAQVALRQLQPPGRTGRVRGLLEQPCLLGRACWRGAAPAPGVRARVPARAA